MSFANLTFVIPKTQKNLEKKKYLNSINYFRGLAIVLIVLSHSYGLAQWNLHSNWQDYGFFSQLFYTFSVNGSVFFVFISGFLYRYIFYEKFDFRKFILKKLKYVLLPYFLISLVPIIGMVFWGDGDSYLSADINNQPLLLGLWYLLTGRTNYAYWYIPMTMIIFAISPIINYVIRQRKVLLCTAFLLPLAMIVHRPIENINVFHSLVYYLPVYLIGIYCCNHQQKISAYLKDNRLKLILAISGILIGIVQIMVFQHAGNFHKEFWAVSVPDINLIQKIIFCFLFLSILDIYEDQDIPAIKKTAETSFAIYFIHPFVSNFLVKLTSMADLYFEGNFFTLVLATLVTVAISIAIASVVKTLLKRNSRYLIGY